MTFERTSPFNQLPFLSPGVEENYDKEVLIL
jgi:hypothetical protein